MESAGKQSEWKDTLSPTIRTLLIDKTKDNFKCYSQHFACFTQQELFLLW
jgi:hypothetical protein